MFSPTSLTTNNEDKLYICDYSHDRIFVTDLELNHILHTIESNEYRSNQFCDPYGIYFYAGYLYLCDSHNKKIQKLTSNLVYKKSYKLDYSPRQIKITNNIACIRPLDQCCMYFYELHTFEVKFRYDGHNGSINELNSYFYEYYDKTKMFYCYDENGVLIDEIKTNGFSNKIDIYDLTCLTYINGEILISSKDSKRMLSYHYVKSSIF